MGTFRGRFWRSGVSGLRSVLTAAYECTPHSDRLALLPLHQNHLAKRVIGKDFGVVIDDIVVVPRGLRPLGVHFYCGFMRP